MLMLVSPPFVFPDVLLIFVLFFKVQATSFNERNAFLVTFQVV